MYQTLTRLSQESRWRDSGHRDRRSYLRHTATGAEAVGVRSAFVLARSVAEPSGASRLLRQAGEGAAEHEEVRRVAVPPGRAGGHVQNDEERGRLGQRAVYVGIEAAERLHGRPRDQ